MAKKISELVDASINLDSIKNNSYDTIDVPAVVGYTRDPGPDQTKKVNLKNVIQEMVADYSSGSGGDNSCMIVFSKSDGSITDPEVIKLDNTQFSTLSNMLVYQAVAKEAVPDLPWKGLGKLALLVTTRSGYSQTTVVLVSTYAYAAYGGSPTLRESWLRIV